MLVDQTTNLQDLRSTRSAACRNHGRRDDTQGTGVSSVTYAPPAGRGSEGPEPRNLSVVSCSGRTTRGHQEINRII